MLGACREIGRRTARVKEPIFWLRASYWIGAAADGYATFRMVFPKIAQGPEYRYALGLGASLMLGWTILLIWADRRPVERKGVLLLTACPVLLGLVMAELFAFQAGLVPVEKMLAVVIFLAALAALFTFSYFNAGSAGLEQQEVEPAGPSSQ
jgi:hypothetical protein